MGDTYFADNFEEITGESTDDYLARQESEGAKVVSESDDSAGADTAAGETQAKVVSSPSPGPGVQTSSADVTTK